MFPFIHVGSLNIGTYGLCILIGAVAGIGVALIRAKRRSFPVEDTLFLSFFALIGVGVGAKILYLITILPDLIEHFQEIFTSLEAINLLFTNGFVFYGGLIGAVLVGVNFAKGLAYSANKPLVPVHHLRGHIAALYLTHPELKPPFLCLVASGGHSHIVEVQDYTHYHILGHTVDDAAGEAFDKVARTLGLPYPGGPSVANAAKTGDPKAYRLPVPHVDGKYNVSFSGLKTAVLNEVNKAQMKNEEINVPDLAASFQERIAGILAEKLLLAAADTGAKQVCLAGGVAANGRLRQLVNDGAQKLGAKVYLPELKFCGDNGAMIAAQGYYQYMAGHTAGLDLNGLPTLPIDYE